MRRFVILGSALLLALGLFAGTVLARGNDWGDTPPHGHLLLHGVEIEEVPGGPTGTLWVVTYDKCVELAAGNALPVPAHHHSVHLGAAGGSPFVQGALWNAGHGVVPLAPFADLPWTGCDDFPDPLVMPAPEE